MRYDKYVTPQFIEVEHLYREDDSHRESYPPELICLGRCQMGLAWNQIGGDDNEAVNVSTALIAKRVIGEDRRNLYAVRIPFFKVDLPDAQEQEALLREAALKLVYCYLICPLAVSQAQQFLNKSVQEEPFSWLGVIDGFHTITEAFLRDS